MLSDLQLFVITWTLAIVSFGLLIQHLRIFFQDGSIHRISFVGVILCSICGILINYLTWIPVTEYNDDTVWFRIFRARSSFFFVMLVFGIGWSYFLRYLRKPDPEEQMEDQ